MEIEADERGADRKEQGSLDTKDARYQCPLCTLPWKLRFLTIFHESKFHCSKHVEETCWAYLKVSASLQI